MTLEYQLGDVINVKGKGPISRIISAFTHSPYTHTACYVGEGNIVESTWGGVKVSSIDKYKNHDIFRNYYANERQCIDATTWMLNQVGAGYDYRGLVGIALSLIKGRRRNKLDNKNKYWCSELVADGYILADIKNDFNPNTWLTTPADFAKSKCFRRIKDD